MRSQTPFVPWVARFWYLGVIVVISIGFYVRLAVDTIGQVIGTDPVLGGDPWTYLKRWESVKEGLIPYLEGEFEHLPLALVLIVMVGLVADLTTIPYWNVFAGFAMVMTWATAYTVRNTGLRLNDDTAIFRFLVLAGPLMPLVLFRTDVLSTMLASMAILAWVAGQENRGMAAVQGGVLAKGWPVVLAVSEWWRGRQARAALIVAFTMSLTTFLILTPGFQSGRAFRGIHLETLVGSILLFVRVLSGDTPGTFHDAGALYLTAGGWQVAINVAIGTVFGLVALRALRHRFSWRRAHILGAALTLAVILGSPLFSPQFLIWVVPFLTLVAGPRTIKLWVAMTLVTILYVGFWDVPSLWWSAALLARNILFVILAVEVTRSAVAGVERTA